jgi:hypothetical protein
MRVKPVKGWFCPDSVIPDGVSRPGTLIRKVFWGFPLSAAQRRGLSVCDV